MVRTNLICRQFLEIATSFAARWCLRYEKLKPGYVCAYIDFLFSQVGCGCGFLSMLAADAEASRVIGIESSAIAKIAQQIVADNQLDEVVTVIRGKVEEVELPDGIKEVDIIIAEWVGHGLFSKNKLGSLIYARDKWLAPDGLVFPDRCRLFIGGAEGALWREERYGFWNQV